MNRFRFDDTGWRRASYVSGGTLWLVALVVMVSGNRFRISTSLPHSALALAVVLCFLAGLVAAVALARHHRLTGNFSYRWIFLILSLFLAGFLVGFGVH